MLHPILLTPTVILSLLALPLAVAGCSQPGVIRCGTATVTVQTPAGPVAVVTELDTSDLFGSHIESDELVRLLHSRVRNTGGKPEAPPKDRLSRGEYHVQLAIDLLARTKDPRAPRLFVRLLDDPQGLIRSPAARGLAELGYRPALPHLLQALRRGKSFNGPNLVDAIGRLGDDTAVPTLIEAFAAGGVSEAEALFKAIESITGSSLAGMRERWGLTYYGDALPAFRQAMHAWWAENRRRVSPGPLPGRTRIRVCAASDESVPRFRLALV